MEGFQDFARVVETGAPLASAQVAVYVAGSLSLAAIYSANDVGQPLVNPFAADPVSGYFHFYAADGRYDVTISKSGATTYTWADQLLDEAP